MTVTFSTTPSSSRMLRSGVARLMSLMSVSCLAGVTDSVMSPYLCPEVRARTGSPEAGLCGLMISARFATHILLILVWAELVTRLGARTILVTSAMVCGLANLALASVVLVSDSQTFTVLTFLCLILSMVGDSGVFSSVYVLAGQTVLTSSSSSDSKSRMRMTGPAWIETLYGCGSMLGPPVGGLIYVKLGFGGVISVAGAFMVMVSIINWIVLFQPPENKTMTDIREVSEPHGPHFSEEDSCDEDIDKQIAFSLDEEDPSYCRLLASPVLLGCCLLQVSSGMMSSWHLASLQSHLADTMSLSTGQIGLVYMSQSLVYTGLTPLVGLLLDSQPQHGFPLLVTGVLANILGYSLLGPSSLLTRVPPHVALTVTGLVLIGLGQATCLITCLKLMLASTSTNESQVSGSRDPPQPIRNEYVRESTAANERQVSRSRDPPQPIRRESMRESTAARVTSVWECCEMVGGYLGSSLGGLAVDNLGFREATNIMIIMEVVIITLLIPFSLILNSIRRT